MEIQKYKPLEDCSFRAPTTNECLLISQYMTKYYEEEAKLIKRVSKYSLAFSVIALIIGIGLFLFKSMVFIPLFLGVVAFMGFAFCFIAKAVCKNNMNEVQRFSQGDFSILDAQVGSIEPDSIYQNEGLVKAYLPDGTFINRIFCLNTESLFVGDSFLIAYIPEDKWYRNGCFFIGLTKFMLSDDGLKVIRFRG